MTRAELDAANERSLAAQDYFRRLFALRRAVVGTPSDRVEVTKAATYLTAAALAFVAIGLHVHWAIGASIAAVEAALVFDIITIIARRTPAHGE